MFKKRILLLAQKLSLVIPAKARSIPPGLKISRIGISSPPCLSLEGLRIGFLADLHCSSSTPLSYVKSIANRLSKENLDILILGGDLILASENNIQRLRDTLSLLADVPTSVGTYMVLGNHEGILLSKSKPAMLEHTTIRLLRNSGATVCWRGKEVYIFGLDDEETGQPDITTAVNDNKGNPILLVAHNPDSMLRTAALQSNIWLALSGHLHGGQVRLPLVGPVVSRSKYPHMFDRGLSAFFGFHLYITQGAGFGSWPFRFLCPPEVCILQVD